MAIEQRNYDPAIMYGADKNMTVDLGSVLDSNENKILQFDAVTSATNFLRLANAATADPIILSCEGTADRGFEFHNDQGEEILILTPVATALNQLTVTSSATGNPVLLSNDGEDDIGFEFHAKNGEEILKLEATAAAITFVSVKSQSTGNNPEISAEGEVDLGITFMNDQAEELLILNSAATSVNEVTITSAATGVAPSIAATGGDTDIDLALNAKAAGRVVTSQALLQEHGTTAAINATATATAAEAGTGYITSTSGAATTITLPTGTALGSELGAVAGTIHELYIDNTAGSNTVTIAVATNGILSDAAATTAASFGQLTVASGVTGQARFTLMFSSATAYTFTRTA